MKKGIKKSVSTDDLAVMVANGLHGVGARFDAIDTRLNGMERELKKEIGEVRENLKATRRDILDIGDRFVPRYEFDNLLVRFNKLEQKVKEKVR